MLKQSKLGTFYFWKICSLLLAHVKSLPASSMKVFGYSCVSSVHIDRSTIVHLALQRIVHPTFWMTFLCTYNPHLCYNCQSRLEGDPALVVAHLWCHMTPPSGTLGNPGSPHLAPGSRRGCQSPRWTNVAAILCGKGEDGEGRGDGEELKGERGETKAGGCETTLTDRKSNLRKLLDTHTLTQLE